jgi:protease PrsW
MKRSHNLWRTGIFNVIFQVLFLLVLYTIGRDLPIRLSGWQQILFDLVIVFIPCAVWSFFFYLQDRVEPEPTQYVLASILVGMALAQLIGIPLERTVVRVDTWLYTSTRSLILGSIFFVGTLHSALFYLGIRYGFYPSREFDEPVDGVVYGAFIGSGYAAVKSFAYLFAHGGMTLFAVAYTATTNILIYASIASLLGLFVAKAKFGKKPRQAYFLVGMALSILLVALHQNLSDSILIRGLENGYFHSFLFTLVFACAILGVVCLEMRRLTARPALQPERHGDFRPDWLVLAMVAVCFAIGAVTRANALSGTAFRSDQYPLAFYYPHSLVSSASARFIHILDDNIFAMEKLGAKSDFKSQYSLAVRSGAADLDGMDPFAFISGSLQPLSVVAREKISLGGTSGVRLKYSYMRPSQGNWVPEQVLVFTDIVPRGSRTYIFSFQASRQSFDEDLPLYSAILQSVTWYGREAP